MKCNVDTSRASCTLLCLCLVVCTTSCSDQSATPHTETPKNSIESKAREERDRELEALTLGPSKSSLTSALNRYMPNRKPILTWQDFQKAGVLALHQKDYESADYLLSEAIKLAPNQGTLYNQRGKARCNSVATNDQGALSDFLKAKELGALSDGGYGHIARLYDSTGQSDKALQVLCDAIKMFPNTKNLYQSRAAIYATKGQKKKAKSDYDMLIKLEPDDATGLLRRAQLSESMGEFELALKDYDSASKIANGRGTQYERHKVALKSKAMLLAKLGRYKEALAVIDLTKPQERDDEEMKLRGDWLAALNRYDEAIAAYTESIESAPEIGKATYEARAKIFDKVGKPELAQKDRAKAKKLSDAPAEKTLYKLHE